LQGKQFEGVAEALREGDLDTAGLEPPERLLLEFAGTISMAAYRVTDEQVHGLREVGWTDEQIAEASLPPLTNRPAFLERSRENRSQGAMARSV